MKRCLNFFLVLLIVFCSSDSFGQKTQQLEDFSIKNRGMIGGRSIQFADSPIWLKLEDRSLDFFAIALGITKKKDTEIDMNKFYLVDHKNKLRYRLIDCIILKSIFSGINGGERHVTERPWENEEQDVLRIGETYERVYYNPEVHDSFKDYTMEGYTDISNTINFGNKRNPLLAEVYYSPINYKKKLNFYLRFAVKTLEPKQSFDLYYGEKKVFEINR